MSLSPSQATKLDEAIEWHLCNKSYLYFIQEYCFIYDPVSKDWIPFHLWPFQVDTLDAIHTHQLVIILKARQLGLTWLVLAYFLWLMLFRPISHVLLFSLREIEAIDLASDNRLRGMYARLPAWMKQKVTGDDKKLFKLANESTARAFATGTGDSYQAGGALVDEADLIPDLDNMIGRIKPTIDAGGKLILLSRVDKRTPKSPFKTLFRAAQLGQNSYHPIFIPWHAHPGRDADWYDKQKRDMISQDDLWEQYPATEQEALAPGYAGLVFSNFSMTDNVSLDADYDPNYPLEWWVDVGYTNPTAILLAQWRPFRGFPDCVCVFAMVYHSQHLPRASIEQALALGYPAPEVVVYDSAAPSWAAEFINVRNEKGLDSSIRGSFKNVDENIRNARNYIGDDSHPRLLQIHPRCDIVIDELMNYHYKKAGLSPSGEQTPERSDDHTCFVAGTMIMTIDGQRPIETIKVGDLVLTRDGFYPVKASALTNENATLMEVLFSNGQRLIATPDHPIYVRGSGFTRLDALVYGIIVLTLENNRDYVSWLKQSSTTALPIAVTRNRAAAMIGCILSALVGSIKNWALNVISIAKSGVNTMGIFQKVATSIMSMAIPSIIPLKTWNALPQKNMRPSTPTRMNGAKNAVSISFGLPIRYAKATVALLVNSVVKNQNEAGLGCLTKPAHARFAGNHLKAAIQKAQRFVATVATPNNGAIRNWTGLTSRVNIAEQSLVPTDMINNDSVHVIALKWLDSTDSVYALEIEHPVGEYYANGVLVKNCAALMYGLAQRIYQIGG